MAKANLSDLPDEVRELVEPHMAESAESLAAIGVALAKKRDEAKAARTASGIETIWKEVEEAYIGIDDANRSEFQDAKWAKPMSMDGPVTTGKVPKQTEHKSTAFVRLTARYVDAGSAKLNEILLPADDKAFKFSEMPVPELIKAKDDKTQVVHNVDGTMVPLTRPARPGEAVPPATAAPAAAAAPGGAVPSGGAAAAPMPAPPGGGTPMQPGGGTPPQPGGAGNVVPFPTPAGAALPGQPPAPPAPPQVPLTVADLAEENIAMARKSAKAAEDRIYGWMVECQHAAEMRKVIDDAARMGVGVLNGPIPLPKKGVVVTKAGAGGLDIQFKEKLVWSTRWRDPWNIFPDPACGENIHDGDHLFDREWLSPRKVRDLKKIPGYINDQIDLVLKEGPDGTPNKDQDMGAGGQSGQAKTKGRFEVWYYYGSLKKSEMGTIWKAAGKSLDDLPPDKAEVYAIVTMINDHVVRATINPLDSGSFPYHSVPWQRRNGHWAGIGVGEQIKMPQKMINAATRAMLNNAGKSAGSQIVVDRGAIQPADGSWTITPDKIWNKSADSASSVQDAFAMHPIENVTDQLMKVINYALQLAEESTSIPLITQGLSGDTQPDTLGATNIQNNNANQLLRSIGYSFDDYITEPVVRQYYECLLIDPEVPDDEKGEFTINAHGSIALVERAIQDQTIQQMGQTVLNPIFGIDPKKWMGMFLKSKRLNPDDLKFTPEQQKKLDETPPPPPPPVQVAQIQAQTAAQALAAKQGTDQQSAQSEERIAQAAAILDGSKVEAENNRTLVQHVGHMHELQTRHEIALLDYASKHGLSLIDARKELAKTAMTIDAQKELNAADNLTDLHKHHTPGASTGLSAHTAIKPPAQVPGRAGNGRSFEQGPAK